MSRRTSARRTHAQEERVGIRQSRKALYAAESASLERSEVLVNELSDNIANAVFSVEEQDSKLAQIRMRFRDMHGVLGLSRSVISLIRGRTKGDRLLVYGGLFLILCIILLLYFLLK